MDWPAALVVVCGLMVGSFLNVCIHRIPRGQSVILRWSRCPHCETVLKPWENVPIAGFLLLRGKCSTCQARISWLYPIVEASTALLFFLLFSKYGLSWPLMVNAALFAMLVVLMAVDIFERILPDRITLGGLLAGFLVSPLQSGEFFQSEPFFLRLDAPWSSYLHSGMGALLGGGLLWLVAFLYLKIKKVEGMGFGDIKMMAMVGAFLGWRYAWLTIFWGSLMGAVLGSAYIYFFGKSTRYELPFGTFLGAGAIFTTLWGRDVLEWYLSLL